MAMKKSEMEDHARQYDVLIGEALAAEEAQQPRLALEKAVACLPHVDGMMRFERKYADAEFESVRAIDLVLKYAPLLFERAALNEVHHLLNDTRLVERHTSHCLADKLHAAQTRMWQAHRLWDHLERNPNCRMDELLDSLSGEEVIWQSFVALWESMELVHRKREGRTYRLSLRTMMSAVVAAKCPSCGYLVNAAKSACLVAKRCPSCASSVMFVIVPRPARPKGKV